MSPGVSTLGHSPQRLHQLQARRLVLLEVDQELGQPLSIGSLRQATDQRGTVGFGSGEDARSRRDCDAELK
jgi:hypothetical protein